MSHNETMPEQTWPPAPDQSPLFHSLNSSRYDRQDGIRLYERITGRSMIVFWGPIFPYCIPYFFDAVTETDIEKPLDLMLTTNGGDPEVALRMAKICRARKPDFRVIVPDEAASAGTLLALAADSVRMSSLSALGPIDPQLYLPGRIRSVPAKAIIAISNDIDSKSQTNPQLFELLPIFLADIDATVIQDARDAVGRIDELVPELIKLRHKPPSGQKVKQIIKDLQAPVHWAAIGYDKATQIGIPTEYLEPVSEEWDMIWRLHTKYVTRYGPSIDHDTIIEGHRVSYEISTPASDQQQELS